MNKLFLSLLLIFFFCLTTCFADDLITEPDNGRAPILSLMNKTKSSMQLVMYGLTDPQLIDAISKAQQNGKNVQVILEPHPYKSDGENDNAFQQLQSAHVTIEKNHPNTRLVHQKTLLIDQDYAMIMTFNFTRSSFKNERNFALIITDPAEIQEIKNVFIADWNHKIIPVKNPNLVWSPDNSRKKIIDFIESAHSTIKIYAQSLTDYQTIGALAKAARSGIHVQILLSDHSQHHSNKKWAYLKRAGATIHFSKQYMIHAKVILIDEQRALLGSINLTQPSIENNRELSVITDSSKVVTELNHTFDHDWF